MRSNNISVNDTKHRLSSEKGYALIGAIMACLLLLALAMLVVSLSTQDLRISVKLVGEKKALAAAEAGIHNLTRTFDPQNLNAAAQTGTTTDVRSQFTVSAATRPTSGPEMVPLIGYSIGGGQQWGQRRYHVDVTGRNTEYQTTVTIGVGVGYGPIEISTMSR